MPACARREIVDEDAVGIYHCIARCVRQAYLCGPDHASGGSFDHRKVWVEKRLETLASIFAIEIATHAIMSNHFPLVVRIRPDLVESWTDQEVAIRAARLSLRRFADRELSEERQAEAINALAAGPKRIAKARKKLKSLSWFMRYLCEYLSRRANAEEGKSGRFFDGRFRSVRLLDESAALACSMYVDLNPIRAQLALTPEESQHTSAYDRIKEMQAAALAAKADRRAKLKRLRAQKKRPKRRRRVSPWLCEFTLREGPNEPAASAAKSRLTSQPAKVSAADVRAIRENPPARASDRGFLPMPFASYLKLLDWTGRLIREGKRGAIPSELAPILERLQIRSESWLETVLNFGRWFKRAAGRGASLTSAAATMGRHWFQGVRRAAEAFT